MILQDAMWNWMYFAIPGGIESIVMQYMMQVTW